MITKIMTVLGLIVLISNAHCSQLDNGSKNTIDHDSNGIPPRFYVHYDKTMNWGGSVFLFPLDIDNSLGFKPVIETGVARNGAFASIGGYVGYVDAPNGVSGYLMFGVSKVWRASDDEQLPPNLYLSPKIGLDVTCLNLELSHYNDREQNSKLALGVKLRMTEYCAESFVQIINGYY